MHSPTGTGCTPAATGCSGALISISVTATLGANRSAPGQNVSELLTVDCGVFAHQPLFRRETCFAKRRGGAVRHGVLSGECVVSVGLCVSRWPLMKAMRSRAACSAEYVGDPNRTVVWFPILVQSRSLMRGCRGSSRPLSHTSAISHCHHLPFWQRRRCLLVEPSVTFHYAHVSIVPICPESRAHSSICQQMLREATQGALVNNKRSHHKEPS